jgi:Cu2+-exporting ATPase
MPSPEPRVAAGAPELVACAHCQLPVPEALIEAGASNQFCCHGCKTVFTLIHAEGLEAYYDLRGEDEAAPVKVAGGNYEELDDPAFTARYCSPRPDGLVSTELYLEGVHCSACLWLVERSLAQLDGVAEARLNFAQARLKVMWRPDAVPLSAIARRLASLGYPAHPARLGTKDVTQEEERRLLIRLGVAGAVAGNVMLMAFALYGGWLSGMEEEHRTLFRWGSLVASLPAALYSGWPFYRSAFHGLRNKVLHMDLPISLGIGAGFIHGLVNTVTGEGDIYFDSVSALIFLLLVGRLLQLRQQRRASESTELLYALTPSSARRLSAEGEARRVPLEAIQPGDRLEVQAGEMVPTDGVVAQGQSAVDQSLLSGEAMPVEVRRGDPVWGGTTNLQDTLVVEVTHAIRESRVGRIAEMVVDAAQGRAPVVQLADKVAGWFVAVVLVLAVFTYAAWSVIAPEVAIDHAVALLIVSCPCALGLATPLAITAAIGKAARRGILARSGAALEALGSLRRGVLYFDKTGTLTHGRMEVVALVGPDWVKPLIAAAEAGVTHPVGRALRQACLDAGEVPTAERVEVVHGGGLIAQVAGHTLHIGAPRFVRAHSLHDQGFAAQVEAWTQDALTPVWVAVDGRVVAAAGLSDRLRSEAKASVEALARQGFEVHILSGDHPSVVQAVGRSLGLPEDRCHGGQSPEDKLARVKAAGAEGPVVMVGDGVNDAAALAAATVGVAVHGGAETCFAAADVFLQKPGVGTLTELVEGAQRTSRTIRNNILFSLGYNVLGAALAMTGMLNPLVAAILMPISSLVVVTNSFRFRFVERR